MLPQFFFAFQALMRSHEAEKLEAYDNLTTKHKVDFLCCSILWCEATYQKDKRSEL